MNLLCVVGLVVLGGISGPTQQDADVARDRQGFPQGDWPYLYYLDTTTVPPELRDELVIATRFIVPSVSRALVLDNQIPQPVGSSGAYRIDLRGLEWDYKAWRKVQKDYPYHRSTYQHKFAIKLRADWLVWHITDASDNESYYDLLFGEKPKNRDDALKFFDVSNERKHVFGMIEGDSGVSIQPERWLESRPILRGYAWGTRDVFELAGDSDILARPDGGFKHDGEEWIIGIPKVHHATGSRGALQVYWLNNAAGVFVDEAPVKLAEDTTRFKGLSSVRTAGSCIQCHTEGMNFPTVDRYKEFFKAQNPKDGHPLLLTDKKSYDTVQSFFADIKPELERNNEDFARAVDACSGVPPFEAVKAYQTIINFYRLPVTPEQAARELYTDAETLKSAISYAAAQGQVPGVRLTDLAHGRAIPREAWETAYYQAYLYLENFEK